MLMLDTRMEPAVAKAMVQGAPDTLHSEFHLSHTMLLNLLLSEALEPEALLRASFRQFQTERSLPALRDRITRLEVRRSQNLGWKLAHNLAMCTSVGFICDGGGAGDSSWHVYLCIISN